VGAYEDMMAGTEELSSAPSKGFLGNAWDDITGTLSNYKTGAIQGFQEMGRAGNQLAESNPLALTGTPMQEGITNAPAPLQTEQQQQDLSRYGEATGTFTEETIKPVLGAAALVNPVAAATYAPLLVNDIQKSYEEGGIGQAARDLTYGPVVDFASQPDLYQQFVNRPVSTTASGVMSALPLALMGRGLHESLTKIPNVTESGKLLKEPNPAIAEDFANFKQQAKVLKEVPGETLRETPTGESVKEIPAPIAQVESPPVEVKASAKGNDIITAGEEQMGTPYQLGADGINATDCGKFTQDTLAKNGITLDYRTADGQYLQMEKAGKVFTSETDAQVGDLVFFDVPSNRGTWTASNDPAAVNSSGEAYKGITHVGIYAGEGKVLQAGSHGVSYADINAFGDIVGFAKTGEEGRSSGKVLTSEETLSKAHDYAEEGNYSDAYNEAVKSGDTEWAEVYKRMDERTREEKLSEIETIDKAIADEITAGKQPWEMTAEEFRNRQDFNSRFANEGYTETTNTRGGTWFLEGKDDGGYKNSGSEVLGGSIDSGRIGKLENPYRSEYKGINEINFVDDFVKEKFPTEYERINSNENFKGWAQHTANIDKLFSGWLKDNGYDGAILHQVNDPAGKNAVFALNADKFGKTRKGAIESAIKKGKSVPKEVLKDYPDLKEKYQSKLDAIETDLRKKVNEVVEPAQINVGASVRITDRPPTESAKVKFSDPEIEARWQEASKGVKKESLVSEIKESANSLWNKATRVYESLPNTAEFEVMAQMMHDTELAKTIARVDKNYSIRGKLYDEFNDKWRDNIPEGYTTWQPREGSSFYMANTIPESLATKVLSGTLEEVGVTAEQIKQVLAKGSPFKELVVKQEVADTLNKISEPPSESALGKISRSLVTPWKVWTLMSPNRAIKYNLRNITGDADALFTMNKGSFKQVPRATSELFQTIYGDRAMTPEMGEWFRRGGMETTSPVQELTDVNGLRMFEKFADKDPNFIKNAWNGYWDKARTATQFREAIFRYATYLDYLKQMQENGGKPRNFGASIPEEVMALTDIRDRAFDLSNKVLGAYDNVSVLGKDIRTHAIPFWSWYETNFKRYAQFFENQKVDGALTSAISKKLVGSVLIRSPYYAVATGSFVVKAGALWGALQAYNNLVFPNEENELPVEEQQRPHIVLGRDENGKVRYFSRLGALPDFLEWFGLDTPVKDVKDYLDGSRSMKEIVTDMGKTPINKLTQGVSPLIKSPAELLTGKTLFPDAFNARSIKDNELYLANSFGLANEFKAISKTDIARQVGVAPRPSKPYFGQDTGENLLYYKAEPNQSSYYSIQDRKRAFLKDIGKGGDGDFSLPKTEVLRNYKIAIRLKDEESATYYLNEYKNMGGTKESLKKSLESMHPLSGLNSQEKTKFRNSLNGEQQSELENAITYYEIVMLGK
jgi:cell wall-associated NlpC family hydrolase